MRKQQCEKSPVDDALDREELFYMRFMDDWVVLAKTRRHLRRAVRITNQILSALKLEKHPNKAFIGLIERGFDILGFHFSPQVLRIARSTPNNFLAKATGPYWPTMGAKPSAHEGAERVGAYVRRWMGWAKLMNGHNPHQPNNNQLRLIDLVDFTSHFFYFMAQYRYS